MPHPRRRTLANGRTAAGPSRWASMLLELSLRHPSWTSSLLDMIDERRDLTALNADTLKGSFPEVDGEEVIHGS